MDKEMLKKLMEPDAYPHDAEGVEMIETHISWIFLAGKFAYKVKRPVKFTFLDFSTLEKRKEHCNNEVVLNSRLCPDMYIWVVPVIEKNGSLHFGGVGKIVEYAVKMKRYPEERRMDRLLEKGLVGGKVVGEIAKMIADFHFDIMKIEDGKYGSPGIVKKQVDDLALHRETIEKACGLGENVDFALERCDSFMEKNKEFFVKRQKEGMIRNCHGDLHSANIFIGEKRICIFDCIEFSKDFRYIDTASEIAFMAMDLDAFGKRELSSLFVDAYIRESKDRGALFLLDYYKCYRANVRAKIAAIEYSQGPNEDSKKRIEKYVELMERYAKGL